MYRLGFIKIEANWENIFARRIIEKGLINNQNI